MSHRPLTLGPAGCVPSVAHLRIWLLSAKPGARTSPWCLFTPRPSNHVPSGTSELSNPLQPETLSCPLYPASSDLSPLLPGCQPGLPSSCAAPPVHLPLGQRAGAVGRSALGRRSGTPGSESERLGWRALGQPGGPRPSLLRAGLILQPAPR